MTKTNGVLEFLMNFRALKGLKFQTFFETVFTEALPACRFWPALAYIF